MANGPSTPTVDRDDFELLAGAALRRVQEAFTGVIEAVPGPIRRPHEISKTLGLHKTLGWKVAKVINSRDPVGIFRRLPGSGAVEKVLDAARRCGVQSDRLERVRAALEALEALVVEHAGDHETFDMLLAGVGNGQRPDVELMYRRDGFRATSHVWGVQASSVSRTVVIHPSDDGRMLDAAIIFGCVGFRRLRAERPWVLNRWRPTDDRGVPIPVQREPIDPVETGHAPVLQQYSSAPCPEVRRTVLEDGTVEDELLDGPIGNAGAVTCFTAESVRSVMSRYRHEANQIVAQNLDLRTPCTRVIFDHLVPFDLYGRVSPRLRVFGELAGRPLYSNVRSNRDRLEVMERVRYLGQGPDALRTRTIARYGEMVAHVCARMEWAVERFDVYRLEMPYPYVPSTITYDYPLPEPPS